MNLHLRKIVTSTRITLCISVLFLLGHFHTVKSRECVKRLEGACKVLYNREHFHANEFHSPPPDGYLLKSTVEIMLKANKHNFEKKLNEEIRRPVVFNNKWKPIELRISLEISKEVPRLIQIDLGLKYDRMARFTYLMYDENGYLVTVVQKWNSFTPILPRFPYRLRLQVTTNGIFSIYADGNDEPFFEHQIEVELFGVGFIHINPLYYDDELVALVDCSSIGAPNCGSHHIDRLYDCRESLVESYGRIGLRDLTKESNDSKIFDEYFIVDPTALPIFVFEYADYNNIEIGKRTLNLPYSMSVYHLQPSRVTSSILYEDAAGHISKDDWCDGEPQPELYVQHTKENKILDIGKFNREILSELQSLNNVTASAFKTLVSKLESLNQTIVSELQSIKQLTANQTKMNL